MEQPLSSAASGAGYQAAKLKQSQELDPNNEAKPSAGLQVGTSSSVTKMGQESTEKIKIMVRIRPPIEREVKKEDNRVVISSCDAQTVEIHTNDIDLKCKYDRVLDSDVNQEQVYHEVKECAEAALQGFNATLFAYGQTGSGKTYTMYGPEGEGASRIHGSEINPKSGIIPRTIHDLFAGVQAIKHRSGNLPGESPEEIEVFCSFVQIYNENLYDLLRDSNRSKPLSIHEDRRNGIYVEGLSEYSVRNSADCLEILRQGEENRAIRQTHMNQVSSRSHSLLQLLVERRSAKGVVIKSKLNLVDLAGSEKWNIGESMQDAHISEMTNINLSLHTLGRVIAALTSKNSNAYIPYRDSKLTRLLQDSLGGNTKTRVIATLSPALDCVEESVNTLRFADRARQVMQFARVNEQKEINLEYVQKLEAENAKLKKLVAQLSSQGKGTVESDVSSPSDDTNESSYVREENEHLNREYCVQAGARSDSEPVRSNVCSKCACLMSGRSENNDTSRARYPTAGSETDADGSHQQTLLQLIGSLDKFFSFEIEEDELRSVVKSIRATLGCKSPTRKIGGDKAGILSPVHPTPSKYALTKPKSKLAFRVRGKSGQSEASPAPQKEDTEKQLTLNLKKTRNKLKKQLELQQWLQEKEEKELAKLAAEEERVKAEEKSKKERDEKFRKRALATKQRLEKLRRKEMEELGLTEDEAAQEEPRAAEMSVPHEG